MSMKKQAQHGGFHVSKFYVIYAVVTISAILVIVALLGVVSNRLAEYEGAQPKYVASDVFNKYFAPINSSGNYNELFSADKETVRYDAGLASTAEIIDHIKNEIGGQELTYSIVSSQTSDEIRYIVKAGEKQLATFTLTPGEPTEHGYKTYKFSYIELLINSAHTPGADETEPPPPEAVIINIDAPSSYTVTVDGVALTTADITSSHTREDVFKYYPSGVTGVPYTVYTLKTLTELPEEVVVTDLEGTQAEVEFDADTNTYTAGITYSRTLAETYSADLTDALQKFAAYVQAARGVSLGSFSGYFDKSSSAYEDVEEAGGNRWTMYKPDSLEYENVRTGEFYSFSQTVFSCRVSFTMVLHRDGKEDYTDTIDKYVFLHMTDDGFKIYEWYNA